MKRIISKPVISLHCSSEFVKFCIRKNTISIFAARFAFNFILNLKKFYIYNIIYLNNLLKLIISLSIISIAGAAGVNAQEEVAAKRLFGFRAAPAPLEARAIGSYAKGCLAGGTSVEIDGPYWQVMRLSRNRNWGHPNLIKLVKKLANDAGEAGDWRGLLVGDLAQPRGGPMLSGHRSHQIGLDADIWLNEMPDRRLTRKERQEISAVSVVNFKTNEVNRQVWSDRTAKLIRRASRYPEVARIFVNPIIKKELCRMNWQDRSWLSKVRPWLGHHYHMHIRISCPNGSTVCKNQAQPAAGDGCGEDLARWFRPPPKTDKKKPVKKRKPRPELTLASLPNACRSVLNVAAKPFATSAPKTTPPPRVKPRT